MNSRFTLIPLLVLSLVTPVCCAIERVPLAGTSAATARIRILWTGPKGPGRNHLILRAGNVEGQSFVFGPGKSIATGPSAYSDLTVLKDQTVGIFWERDNYKYLTFTRIGDTFFKPAAGRD